MDQEAFRKLVASGAEGDGASLAGVASNRSFGKKQKRTPSGVPNAASAAVRPSDLRPRTLHKKSSGPAKGEDGYHDRAAARRLGKQDAEFGDVQVLHTALEARLAHATTETERTMLQDQIRSVGGDAKHSVLVKGLDWALLAEEKAKIARQSGAHPTTDDDLEVAFEQAQAGKDVAQSPQHSALIEPKRTRQEIIDALKQSQKSKAHADTVQPQALGKRFRPIGFKPISEMSAPQPQSSEAEYKWVNGKRMRKKKKQLKPDPPGLETTVVKTNRVKQDGVPSPPHPTTQALHPASSGDEVATLGDAPSLLTWAKPLSSMAETSGETSHAESAERARLPGLITASDEESDEDGDIFADAGGWEGLADADADEDADASRGQHGDASSSGVGPDAAADLALSMAVGGHALAASGDDGVAAETLGPPRVSSLQAGSANESEHAHAPQASPDPIGPACPATASPDPAPLDATPLIPPKTPPPVPLGAQTSAKKRSKWLDDDDDTKPRHKKKKGE